jgi:hypothetical protein
MSIQLKTTPKKANGASSFNLKTQGKNADDSSFTMVSYQRKPSALAHPTTRSTKAGTMNVPDTSSTKAETTVDTKVEQEGREVTVGNFKQFQNMIHPIIETIIGRQHYKDHASIKKWIEAKKRLAYN